MSDEGTPNTQVRQPVREVVVERQPESHGDGNQIPKWAFDQRISEERKKADAVRAELSTAMERINSLSQIESAKTAAEQEAAKWRRLYETDTPMLTIAPELPSLAHDEVRDFFRGQHDAHVSRAGDKAQPFAEWLASQRAQPSPLLAPYLSAPPAADASGQVQAPAARPVARVAPPAVDTGAAAANPGIVARYSEAEIGAIFRTKPRSSEEYKRAEAQLRADGLIR